MHLLVVAAAYAGVFAACEYTYRSLHLSTESARRYVHLFSGLLTVLASLWLTREEIMGMAALFVGALFVSKRFMLLASVHATRRATWGEIFFPAGIGLGAYLYLPDDPQLYYLSILILSLSDPLANWLGGRFRGPPLVFGKTFYGSVAFFASSLLIALLFVQPGAALLVAVCATVGEALGPYGSDNLSIVPAVGLPLLFLPGV